MNLWQCNRRSEKDTTILVEHSVNSRFGVSCLDHLLHRFDWKIMCFWKKNLNGMICISRKAINVECPNYFPILTLSEVQAKFAAWRKNKQSKRISEELWDACNNNLSRSFVAIDIPPMHYAECIIEMEHRTGNKMRMHFKGTADLDPTDNQESTRDQPGKDFRFTPESTLPCKK